MDNLEKCEQLTLEENINANHEEGQCSSEASSHAQKEINAEIGTAAEKPEGEEDGGSPSEAILDSIGLITLIDWCPVIFFEDGDCCVAGLVRLEGDYRLYRSNVVKRVEEDGRFLVDRNDRCCRLEGKWCKNTYDRIAEFENVRCVENFPERFDSAFENGFPENWSDVIKETVAILSREAQQDCSSPILSPMPLDASYMTNEINQSVANATDCNFVFEVLRDGATEPEIVADHVKELHVDRLDCQGPLELISALKRTRSGRLVRPPLDTWRGQYLDVEGDRITICPGSESDLIYLKWLGLKPRSADDSGYLSPPKRAPRGRRRAGRTVSASVRQRKKTSKSSLFSPTSDSSASDSPQSLRSRILKNASEKRLNRSTYGDKSTQMSPQRLEDMFSSEMASFKAPVFEMSTQTTELDSGIAPGIPSVREASPKPLPKMSVSSPCPVRLSPDASKDEAMLEFCPEASSAASVDDPGYVSHVPESLVEEVNPSVQVTEAPKTSSPIPTFSGSRSPKSYALAKSRYLRRQQLWEIHRQNFAHMNVDIDASSEEDN